MKTKSLFKYFCSLSFGGCVLWYSIFINHSNSHFQYLITIFFTLWIGLSTGLLEKILCYKMFEFQLREFQAWGKFHHFKRIEAVKLGEEDPGDLQMRPFMIFYASKGLLENKLSDKIGVALDLVMTVAKGICLALFLITVFVSAFGGHWEHRNLLLWYPAARFAILFVFMICSLICKLWVGRYPNEARSLRKLMIEGGFKKEEF